MNELPTIGDLRDAINTLDHARERRDLPSRDYLRQWQAAIVNFWHVAQRFHAQAEAVEILNDARATVFRRPPLAASECGRLYSMRRSGTRRSDLIFYPSMSRLCRALLALPGAANRCQEIASALGADVRNVKSLLSEIQARKVPHAA